MRLGIDFGTTRTRVAAAIKGNFPLITFQEDRGGGADWYPSLIAVQEDRFAFGLRAQAVRHEPDWEVLGSFKRLLSDANPDTVWKLGGLELPAIEWLTRFFAALRTDLLQRSNLDVARRERIEVMVGIPANANSNQRFLTLEAFARTGFEVIGMLNEPSAAGMEFAHRYRGADLTRRHEHVVVYDLGGGTFDVSVVSMVGQQHEVLASEGITRLGGDDFDESLFELALAEASLSSSSLPVPRSRFLTICREAKESITPNSRKILLDFGQLDAGLGEVVVPVAQFYDKCLPLIVRTIGATEAAVQKALGTAARDVPGLVAVYLVGGTCELPILARALRNRFGKKVRRSPYPSAATAIGLAIAADQESGYTVQDRFSRHFGVWREAESGQRITFDAIFGKDTPLPKPGQPPLVVRRRYCPTHNIGRFRFLECSTLGEGHEPTGDILSWNEMTFPFDTTLAEDPRLESIPVERTPEVERYEIEEMYECDTSGVIQVTITNLVTGHTRAARVR
jgi:molecular chaperone DnaK (HSP70)